MIAVFLMLSVLMCVIFYFNLDPIKCRFFLVVSLLCLSFFFSFGLYVWYSYYICIIFLSGIFVILVYFSGLSKFININKPLRVIFFFFVLLVNKVQFRVFFNNLGINEFYYDFYYGVVVYIVIILLFFLGFVRYNITLGVALRKI